MVEELKEGEQILESEKVVEEPVATVATVEATAEAIPGKEVVTDQPPDAALMATDIERLKKVKEKAEADAQYWRKQKAEARADYFKSRGEPPPQPPPPKVEDLGIGPEPRQEDFDDYQKYLDAKIGFEVNKAKTTWDREQARKQENDTYNQKMTNLHERIGEGFKKYEDFEEVAMDRTVPITPMIMEILAEADNPHDVAYYLGKNRMEAIQISKMTPIQAAKAIAKIEVALAEAGATPPPVIRKIVTGAPPPIKAVGSSHTVEKDPNKFTSQREYEEWRKQNPNARRF